MNETKVVTKEQAIKNAMIARTHKRAKQLEIICASCEHYVLYADVLGESDLAYDCAGECTHPVPCYKFMKDWCKTPNYK